LLTWSLQINLVANHVLSPNSQVFIGFANNIIKGELQRLKKHVTKEHHVLERIYKFEEAKCNMETAQPQFNHLGFLSNE